MCKAEVLPRFDTISIPPTPSAVARLVHRHAAAISLIFSAVTMVLSFILIQNRQGKTRLAKWYAPYTDEEKVKLKGEVSTAISITR